MIRYALAALIFAGTAASAFAQSPPQDYSKAAMGKMLVVGLDRELQANTQIEALQAENKQLQDEVKTWKDKVAELEKKYGISDGDKKPAEKKDRTGPP